jgi:hypothetical protein
MQAAEVILGKKIRCFGCQRLFVAGFSPPAPPPETPPHDDEDLPSDAPSRCARCGKPIVWTRPTCNWCGARRQRRPRDMAPVPGSRFRRDCLPHRARFIQVLGSVCVVAGCLSLCLAGTGSLVSVPLGMLVWKMANRDLELMRKGEMDPLGQPMTEDGRTNAIVGVILGLLFAPLLVAALHLR